ncbi:MAG: hypothetical protein JRN20_18470 [Nitrososphaerota archaeon]|nr:hypothetical protein [Nitrososphaerota archaeon]
MTSIEAKKLFDLALSLRAASSFSGIPSDSILRIPVRIDHKPVVIVVRRSKKNQPIFFV